MSFDVLLRGSHPSAPLLRRDPITGLMGEVRVSKMTRDEQEAALAVLRRESCRAVEGGTFIVTLAGGSFVEVVTRLVDDVDDEAWSVLMRGFGPEEAQLLFDLTHAGAFLGEKDEAAFATTRDVVERLGEADSPDCVVVPTVTDLSNVDGPAFTKSRGT
jgi:hypothetical protein